MLKLLVGDLQYIQFNLCSILLECTGVNSNSNEQSSSKFCFYIIAKYKHFIELLIFSLVTFYKHTKWD